MRTLAALSAACALLAAGCGGNSNTVDRTWRQNAAGLVAQLRADVAAVEAVPPSQSPGTLYALLIAYSDMGGCSAMVAATGAPPHVQRVLAQPCPHLERAATLFTHAETNGGVADLRRAAREAGRASVSLVRAAVATCSASAPRRTCTSSAGGR